MKRNKWNKTLDRGEEKAVSNCFVAETQNILHFYSSVLKSDRELFREFHDFSLKCGKPIATILRSSRVNCRKCGKKLAFENKVIPVVIYSNRRGTYLGSRLTIKCAVNVKFTNTMVIGLSKVSVVLTATLLHRNFFSHPKTLRSRLMF